jgi:hypothetical protein
LACHSGERRAFFRESRFKFINELDGEKKEYPDVKISMDRHRFVIMELAANGFGPPEVLMQTRADLIADAHDYLRFKGKYESQLMLMRSKECK